MKKVVKTKQNQKPKRSTSDKFALTLIILGFIAMLIGFLPLASTLAVIFYEFLLIMFAFLTLFTILLNKDFMNLLNGGNDAIQYINQFIPYAPYVLGASTGLFAISLILYCFSKSRTRKIAGIIFSALFLLGSIAGIILSVYPF